MMAYRVETIGDWAGAPRGQWRPAVAGTVNQTGLSDAEASTAPTRGEAEDLADYLIREYGAERADLRIVEVE